MPHEDSTGFCYDVHVAKPTHIDCMGTFFNVVKGMTSLAMFAYVFLKMYKNHRRALAGYTMNTINIDVHMTLMLCLSLSLICWGGVKVFDVSNTDANTDEDEGDRKYRLRAFFEALCISITSFVEALILLLLCSSSIGQNHFHRSWFTGTLWGMINFLCVLVIASEDPGGIQAYWISHNVAIFMLCRDIFTILMNIGALIFFHVTKSERMSIVRYAVYMISLYSVLVLGKGLLFAVQAHAIDAGICISDITELLQFITFAPMVYLTLKRDCQYWGAAMADENEEEQHLLLVQNNKMTWAELPNFQDVVIPKTELYYRSKLEERVDVNVEIHLWRRKFVVVKRFTFDLLTRDNIKFFKTEANIFKTLHHENIVTFFGVVIDPPSLAIVMQYAAKGDLFKLLETKRNEMRSDERGGVKVSKRRSTVNVNDLVVRAMEEKEDGNFEVRMTSVNDDDAPSSTEKWRSRLSMGVPLFRTSFSKSPMAQKDKAEFDPLICALQVAQGMNYLHGKDVVHRDLKSMNVLLDDVYTAKIADFGESAMNAGTGRHAVSHALGEIGTAGWAAPESMLGKGASKMSDVFSFGIVLWELLTWRAPSVLVTVRMLKEQSLASLPGVQNHFVLRYLSEQAGVTEKPVLPMPSKYLGIHLPFGRSANSDKEKEKKSPAPPTESTQADITKSPLASLDNHRASASSPVDSASSAGSPKSFSIDILPEKTHTEKKKSEMLKELLDNTNTDLLPEAIEDDDLTMVEMGNMMVARELMCVRKLRPPMPLGVPPAIISLLRRSWADDPNARPQFTEVVIELDRILQGNAWKMIEYPCEVEATVNTINDDFCAYVQCVLARIHNKLRSYMDGCDATKNC